MTPGDPKRTTDEYDILGAPRFVAEIPGRTQTSARADAVAALLDALRARPNTWAAVSDSEKRHVPATVTEYFKNGRYGPAEHWEVAVRRNPETSIFTAYVKYVGRQLRTTP